MMLPDMSSCPLSLSDFLAEAELEHYHTLLRRDLKISNVAQLKYVEDEDLLQVGMSRPEQRRLKKHFHKYYPQSYLGKFVKIMQTKTSSSGSLLAVAGQSQNGALSRRNSGVDQWEVRRQQQQQQLLSPTKPYPPPLRLPASPSSTTISKHIPINSIKLGPLLGTGHFGPVYQALWTTDQHIPCEVAVKCLDSERIQSSPSECLKEVAVLHSLKHERLVPFYGSAMGSAESHAAPSIWLVSELAPNRSLVDALRDPLLKSSFSVITLCDMALQICEGMKYLESSCQLVHGGLAARNVLVYAKMKIKISDAGLTPFFVKNPAETDANPTQVSPWYAPETLRYSGFSCSSDVWSFGVTLWEMFSLGAQPWIGLSSHEILKALDSGRRLEQPDLCPRDYYELLLSCWRMDESQRPTFSALVQILPEKKPEQLQVIRECLESASRRHLQYAIGDVITLLDNKPEDEDNLWKGVVKGRKSGLFDPSDTVTYLGPYMLPPSACDSSTHLAEKKNAAVKTKIRRDMISRPQGDFRHTGHVGMDGGYFGDVAFMEKGLHSKPLSARSIDRGDDERSIGYSGSRDATPLISSRLSLSRTIGSESRMSTDSWQNTSSDSPRSSSSRSSGNAKDDSVTYPSPTVLRKPSMSSVPTSAMWRNHTDQPDHGTQLINGKRSSQSDRTFISFGMQDDKFDLDFGPSLMEEVLRMIDKSGELTPLGKNDQTRDESSQNHSEKSRSAMFHVSSSQSVDSEPNTVKPTEKPSEARQVPNDESVTNSKQVRAPATKPPPPPPLKPKPPVMLRKKLDPISIVKDEVSPGLPSPGLKPLSPRDERLLQEFAAGSNQIAAKSLDTPTSPSHRSAPSPALSTKSRFSFRAFRNKHSSTEPALPEGPKVFLPDKAVLDSNLEDQVSEDAKEAYRVLIEEGGQLKVQCAPSLAHSILEDLDEENDESASPLKLLRNGKGVMPKMRGNKNGMTNGFNRSLSQETPKTPLPDPNGLVEAPVSSAHSFSTTIKVVSPLPNNAEQSVPSVDDQPSCGPAESSCQSSDSWKKVERPNMPPPPLPPRDRGKATGAGRLPARQRVHPLVMPANDQTASTHSLHYQNPQTDALLHQDPHQVSATSTRPALPPPRIPLKSEDIEMTF